jgi:hypothetical protein
MELFDPKGLCLREGDLVILERNPAAPPPPPPPEVAELIEPSRGEGSVILIGLQLHQPEALDRIRIEPGVICGPS